MIIGILTAEEAADMYKSYDDWQYADREATWKWMFERGKEAGDAHIYEAEAQQLIRPLREQLDSQAARVKELKTENAKLFDALNFLYDKWRQKRGTAFMLVDEALNQKGE